MEKQRRKYECYISEIIIDPGLVDIAWHFGAADRERCSKKPGETLVVGNNKESDDPKRDVFIGYSHKDIKTNWACKMIPNPTYSGGTAEAAP